MCTSRPSRPAGKCGFDFLACKWLAIFPSVAGQAALSRFSSAPLPPPTCVSVPFSRSGIPGFSRIFLGLQALLEKPFRSWRWPAANGSIPLLPASRMGPCSQRVRCLLPACCLTQQGASRLTHLQACSSTLAFYLFRSYIIVQLSRVRTLSATRYTANKLQ